MNKVKTDGLSVKDVFVHFDGRNRTVLNRYCIQRWCFLERRI